MCHGGTWAGDYVLNVIATGLSLKARGKRRRQRWVDDGRVLALGESRRSSAISVADVVASLTRDVADFPVPGVEFKDARWSPTTPIPSSVPRRPGRRHSPGLSPGLAITAPTAKWWLTATSERSRWWRGRR